MNDSQKHLVYDQLDPIEKYFFIHNLILWKEEIKNNKDLKWGYDSTFFMLLHKYSISSCKQVFENLNESRKNKNEMELIESVKKWFNNFSTSKLFRQLRKIKEQYLTFHERTIIDNYIEPFLYVVTNEIEDIPWKVPSYIISEGEKSFRSEAEIKVEIGRKRVEELHFKNKSTRSRQDFWEFYISEIQDLVDRDKFYFQYDGYTSYHLYRKGNSINLKFNDTEIVYLEIEDTLAANNFRGIFVPEINSIFINSNLIHYTCALYYFLPFIKDLKSSEFLNEKNFNLVMDLRKECSQLEMYELNLESVCLHEQGHKYFSNLILKKRMCFDFFPEYYKNNEDLHDSFLSNRRMSEFLADYYCYGKLMEKYPGHKVKGIMCINSVERSDEYCYYAHRDYINCFDDYIDIFMTTLENEFRIGWKPNNNYEVNELWKKVDTIAEKVC